MANSLRLFFSSIKYSILYHYENPVVRFFLAGLSGILMFLSFPSYNLYYLEWISFIPYLLSIERVSIFRAYLLGLFAGIIGVCGGFYWIGVSANIVFGVAFPINLLFVLGFALWIGQVVGLITLILQWLRKNGHIDDIILFPVIHVFVYSIFPMVFSFKMGDAQAYFLPAVQAIEYTGVYGLDFIKQQGLLYLDCKI